jgi:hypothetical protein
MENKMARAEGGKMEAGVQRSGKMATTSQGRPFLRRYLDDNLPDLN